MPPAECSPQRAPQAAAWSPVARPLHVSLQSALRCAGTIFRRRTPRALALSLSRPPPPAEPLHAPRRPGSHRVRHPRISGREKRAPLPTERERDMTWPLPATAPRSLSPGSRAASRRRTSLRRRWPLEIRYLLLASSFSLLL